MTKTTKQNLKMKSFRADEGDWKVLTVIAKMAGVSIGSIVRAGIRSECTRLLTTKLEKDS